MNALLGRVKMGDLGFDVMHLNLHKTFSTPHGGGGPGAGPVCAQPILQPYLPAPVVKQCSDEGPERFVLVTPEKTIGKVSASHGNFGVLVRAYTYIRTLGDAGLRQVSENAVLNANYLLSKLKDKYLLPFDRPCMHEVVLSANWQKAKGVRGLGDGQATAGLRLPRADDVFPSNGRRGPANRAYGDGEQGDVGRVHRGDARHRPGGHGEPRTSTDRTPHHAGAPIERSAGGPAAGPQMGAKGIEPCP